MSARPFVLVFALVLVVAGCEERRERTISREAFVTVMTDLRRDAARAPLESRTEAEIDQALAQHGVTREQLRTFVEVHGDNVPMMAEVWAEIERRVHADTDGESSDSGDTPPDDPAVPLNGATTDASDA